MDTIYHFTFVPFANYKKVLPTIQFASKDLEAGRAHMAKHLEAHSVKLEQGAIAPSGMDENLSPLRAAFTKDATFSADLWAREGGRAGIVQVSALTLV